MFVVHSGYWSCPLSATCQWTTEKLARHMVDFMKAPPDSARLELYKQHLA